MLSGVVGCAVAAVLRARGTTFLHLMGLPAGSPLLPDAERYLKTRALAAPAFLLLMASEGIFRGHADTRGPLLATLVAALTNLALDPLLMFKSATNPNQSAHHSAGHGGRGLGLGLGLAGAAAATAAAQYAAAAVYVVMLYRRRTSMRLLPGRWASASPNSLTRSSSSSSSGGGGGGDGSGGGDDEGRSLQGTRKNSAAAAAAAAWVRSIASTGEHAARATVAMLPTLKLILAANAALLARTMSLMLCWAVASSQATRMGAAQSAAHQVSEGRSESINEALSE